MPSSTPFRDIFDVFELKDQPDVLKNLKSYVKYLVYDLLDPSHTYGKQPLELQQRLLQKACENFPHLFVGATRNARIRAIRAFAMNRFAYRRSHFRRENESKSCRVKKEPQLSPAPDEDMEKDSGSSINQAHTRERISAIRLGSSGLLINTPASELSPVRCSEPLEPPSNSLPPTSSSSTQRNAAPICQTEEVATFLSSCAPDMKFLLDCFIAYGIVNQEYLRTIAKWPDERIERFLREFSSSKISENITLTDVDIYILAVHFKQYFGQ